MPKAKQLTISCENQPGTMPDSGKAHVYPPVHSAFAWVPHPSILRVRSLTFPSARRGPIRPMGQVYRAESKSFWIPPRRIR